MSARYLKKIILAWKKTTLTWGVVTTKGAPYILPFTYLFVPTTSKLTTIQIF